MPLRFDERSTRVCDLVVVVRGEFQVCALQGVKHIENVDFELALVFESGRDRVLEHTDIEGFRDALRVFGLRVGRHATVSPTSPAPRPRVEGAQSEADQPVVSSRGGGGDRGSFPWVLALGPGAIGTARASPAALRPCRADARGLHAGGPGHVGVP